MTHEFDDGEPTKIRSIDEIDFDRLQEGTIRLDKSPEVQDPTEWGMNLEPDGLSFRKDANVVYRDSRPTNSLQVREYDDYYTIQRDHANPTEGQIIEHYRLDVSPSQKGKIVGGIIVGGLIAGGLIWGSLQG